MRGMSGTRKSAAERRLEASLRTGEEQAEPRGVATRFRSGVSGNPGGRPKGVASAIRDERTRRNLSQEDIAGMLFDSLEDVRLKPMERLAIVREIWDREHGKAPTHEAIAGGDPLELSAITETVKAIADELAARRDAREAPSGDASPVAASG